MGRGIIARILRKGIYMNKISFSQAMSGGWNRKERCMLKEDNMMRHKIHNCVPIECSTELLIQVMIFALFASHVSIKPTYPSSIFLGII